MDPFRYRKSEDLANEPLIVAERRSRPHSHDLTIKLFAEAHMQPQIAQYAEDKTDAVYLLFQEFKSVITQKMVFEKLLPIDPAQPDASGSQVDYIYEQPAGEILNGLMPRYVEARIYRMLADSSAAEHAARMTAMDAATNNAYDLIESLTLQMNKIRQAAITKEIIEVVSGASWSA